MSAGLAPGLADGGAAEILRLVTQARMSFPSPLVWSGNPQSIEDAQ